MAVVPASAATVKNDPTYGKLVVALSSAEVTAAGADIKVTAYSIGEADVKHITIDVPYTASALSYVGASSGSFSVSPSAGQVELSLLRLDHGDQAVATLHFNAAPSVAAGTQAESQARYTWTTPGIGGSGVSNRLVLGLNAGAQPLTTLVVAPSGDMRAVESSAVFVGGEPVFVWATPASGPTIPLVFDHANLRVKGKVNLSGSDASLQLNDWRAANDDGVIRFNLAATDLAPGQYTLVARGYWTGITLSTTVVR
jgi:hypothetical protein